MDSNRDLEQYLNGMIDAMKIISLRRRLTTLDASITIEYECLYDDSGRYTWDSKHIQATIDTLEKEQREVKMELASWDWLPEDIIEMFEDVDDKSQD